MVATKRLARLLSVSIVAMAVLVAVAAPSASAHRGPTIAKGLIPAVGSCEFFLKEEDFFSEWLNVGRTHWGGGSDGFEVSAWEFDDVSVSLV